MVCGCHLEKPAIAFADTVTVLYRLLDYFTFQHVSRHLFDPFP